MKEKTFYAAMYLHLSRDDEEKQAKVKAESGSIAGQRELIRSFISEQPDMELYDSYVDDGWSGGNFDRPEFKRMMGDVEAGRGTVWWSKTCPRFQGQSEHAAGGAYEEYASGKMTQREYRKAADEAAEGIVFMSVQIKNCQEEISTLKDEWERLQADMKQIIRYSHMEELTQELVDTFIKKIRVYKDKRVEIEWNFADNSL